MVDPEIDNIWGQYQARREVPRGAAGVHAIPAATEEAGVDAIPAATEEAGVDAIRAGAGEGGADLISTTAGLGGADPSEEAATVEYRKIAERRVRLGLLLAEVGRKNNITKQDLN